MYQHLLMTMTQLLKKIVTDLLETKAGTNYVNNELAKKAINSVLSNYVLKADLNSSDTLDDNVLKTELQWFATEVSGSLDDKVDYATLVHYSLTSPINSLLRSKANQSDVNTALDLKADKFELTALNNTVNSLDANKTNTADFNT